MIKVTLIVLACTNLLVDFTADLSMPLCLLLNKAKDIKFSETLLLGLECIDNLQPLFERVRAATSTNKKDSWSNELAELLQSLVKVLFSIDNSKPSC